jgi:hypothetical protein
MNDIYVQIDEEPGTAKNGTHRVQVTVRCPKILYTSGPFLMQGPLQSADAWAIAAYQRNPRAQQFIQNAALKEKKILTPMGAANLDGSLLTQLANSDFVRMTDRAAASKVKPVRP